MPPTHPTLYPESADGRDVYWLLTIEWAGHTIRLADTELDVETDDGDWLHFEDGIVGDLEVTETMPLDGSAEGQMSVPIEILMPSEVDVPALVAQGHRLSGARAELSRWVHGTTLEKRRPVLSGRFESPEFGAAEEGVSTSVEQVIWKEKSLILAPTHRVDGVAWEHADTIPVDDLGRAYPLIIGRPGAVSSEIDSDGWITASRATWIDYRRTPHDDGGATGNMTEIRALVAGHHVQAEYVYVNTSTDTGGFQIRVANGFDDLGRPVAFLAWFQSATGGAAPEDDYNEATYNYTFQSGDLYGLGDASLPDSFNGATPSQLYIGWRDDADPSAGGLVQNGKLVREAGDVLLCLLSLTARPVDRGRCEALAPLLSRFALDFMVDRKDATPWGFIRDELLPILPVSVVSGPNGLYFLPWRHDATRADATIIVNADLDPEIERVGRVQENNREVANRFTCRFAYSYRTQTYAASITLGAEGDEIETDGDGTVTRFRTHPACTLSRQDTEGPVDKTISTALVYDEGTAWAILEWLAAVYALPRTHVRYRLPESDYINVERGAVVLLTDSEVALDEQVFVVEEVTTDGSGWIEVAMVRFGRFDALGAAA